MATTQDTTRIADLKARVEALAELPALLEPYTAHGTKLRLPAEIADKLPDMRELSRTLGEVHYEGVHYDYQDESEASTHIGPPLAQPSASEKGVNEAFAKRVGDRIDEALIHIETARRLTDVCSAAVKELDAENSHDIALTMGNELFVALNDARKALGG